MDKIYNKFSKFRQMFRPNTEIVNSLLAHRMYLMKLVATWRQFWECKEINY